jgi:hypothetical protein
VRRPIVSLLATGLLAAALTWSIARASVRQARRPYDPRAARRSTVRLLAPDAEYVFHPSTGRVVARTKDGAVARTIDLVLVVDGDARPLALERGADRSTERNAFGASFGVAIGDETFDTLLALHVDAGTGALAVDLAVQPEHATRPHAFALRFDVPTDGRSAFVSGVGELGDLGVAGTGEAQARAVEVDAEPHPFAIVPASGTLDVSATTDAPDDPTAPMRLSAGTTPRTLQPGEPAADVALRFVFGANGGAIWRSVFSLSGEQVAHVAGVVTGTTERARVYGLDSDGQPRVRVAVDDRGRFAVDVPRSVSLWYAAIDASRTSTPVAFPPGTPWDLRLDVSPGGAIAARIVDADTGSPITARLLVHGIDGTLDPSFGPDYRASGAGPIIDLLRGGASTPVPAGRYRVAATKGLEWSIDAKTIEVPSGRTIPVDLELRHVVPTPGVVGCDLHVHARPSFDTPVLAEDRVLSLVSAGVDFAVPSEHNIVGDYGDPLASLGLTGELAFVPGVEITTFSPRFGHFGLFPYPAQLGGKPPPFKATNVNRVFDFVHKRTPNAVFQVNHPRLGKGIGYFDVFRFDPKKPLPYNLRTDFDTLEVYNGYESRTPDRVEVVMHDWFALLSLGHRYAATGSSDSHRIQYQWAGYPRTMAVVGEDAAGDHGARSTRRRSSRRSRRGTRS